MYVTVVIRLRMASSVSVLSACLIVIRLGASLSLIIERIQIARDFMPAASPGNGLYLKSVCVIAAVIRGSCDPAAILSGLG